MDNIIIKTCDHPYKDIFEYHIINDNDIFIKRIDEKAGWWLDLKIDIINKKSGEMVRVNIGPNPSSYIKIITVNFSLGYYQPSIPDDEKFDTKDRKGIKLDSTTISEKDIILNEDDIVVIISGIVYVSNKGLNGSISRSIISPEERYNQTIQTLQSVITYIPNSKIILLEQSKFFPEDKLINITKYCDYVIQYKNDAQNDYYSNIQELNKGLGEMYVTNHFLNFIKNKNFKIICKMVSRYVLTSKFNIDKFIKDTTFKFMKGDGRLGIITFSNFYSLSRDVLNLYIEHQKIWFNKERKEPIEHILTMFVESIPNINLIPFIGLKGVSGNSGSNCYL